MTDIPSFQPKPFVFVLMPFASEFDDIYRYGIKEACEKAGTYAERVDEQIFQGSILERIYNQIAKANIIIADMTGRNPNVFYETGYAHALGKPTILLTQNSDDIPFDLKHHYHIVYGGRIGNLAGQLEPRVRYFAENLSHQGQLEKSGLVITVNGVEIVDRENSVELHEVRATHATINLTLMFTNIVNKQIRVQRFQPAVIFPSSFYLRFRNPRFGSSMGPVQLNGNDVNYIINDESDSRTVLLLNEPLELFPGAFSVLKFSLEIPDRAIQEHKYTYLMSVRIFQELGSEEYPFTINVHTQPSDAELSSLEKDPDIPDDI